MRSRIYLFLFTMWILILLGGGIAVVILGPVSLSGFGSDSVDMYVTSLVKAVIAITLVVIWVLILSKLKNWIFRREIRG